MQRTQATQGFSTTVQPSAAEGLTAAVKSASSTAAMESPASTAAAMKSTTAAATTTMPLGDGMRNRQYEQERCQQS
ncbi:MAG: hypothetical protein ACYC3X_12945 [Pirellulaceae bacterium]